CVWRAQVYAFAFFKAFLNLDELVVELARFDFAFGLPAERIGHIHHALVALRLYRRDWNVDDFFQFINEYLDVRGHARLQLLEGATDRHGGGIQFHVRIHPALALIGHDGDFYDFADQFLLIAEGFQFDFRFLANLDLVDVRFVNLHAD